ncbi:MAG: hypothetical protein KAR64_00440 [Thermoplasmatales archaeon]|nr:hypothetical protein [Thermoplasmatales archaeon]
MTNKSSKTINIAILGAEPLFWTTCAIRFFSVILDGYQWTKNNTDYRITTHPLSDKDILKGKLKTSNFDVLLIPGGGVGDGLSIMKGFNSSLKVRRWKKNIKKYVENGGGCIGFCGGTSLITPLTTGKNRKPTTFVERQYNKSSLGISSVTSYYKYLAFPLFNLFQWSHPEKIGTTAYVFSFKPGVTKDGKRINSGGAPIDLKVNKNIPIFSDYPDETLRIRWWGGSALIVPKNPDREISILAEYPKVDLHENKSTRIHAWKYTGGILGLIFGFFKALRFIKENKLNLLESPMLTYYFAGNWKLTDKIIESDLANKPAITAEIYPNENKGRIILCTTHPEYMIWQDGHIEEADGKKFNCLATGLYQWKDITKLSEPIDDNLTYTWWVVRRFIAWTAKIPDEYLPPITKQKVSEKDISILSKSIFWDGTLLNQIENI